MLRILMVCTVPTEKSGIPIVVFNLMRALVDNSSKEGLQLGYVSINEPPEYFTSKLKVSHIPYFHIPRKISNSIGYIRQLAKVAKDYDVMHVHGNSATLVLEMIAAKLAGVKVRIAHSHNTTCSAKIIDKLARPLFYALCNTRLACGVEAGKWLFHNRDFVIINNGIDTFKFCYNPDIRNKIREKLGFGSNVVVGHIGNFNYQKNHEFLIKVFTEFHKKIPDSRLLLLGNGSLIDEVKQEVDKLGLSEYVIFTGSVDNPQDYMNVMDIIVMPSRFEGLPLTMVEEQANGLPILAADSITKDANISGDVIYLSLHESASKWANVASHLVKKTIRDVSTSERNVSRIKASGYDINGIGQRLLDYYQEVYDTQKEE